MTHRLGTALMILAAGVASTRAGAFRQTAPSAGTTTAEERRAA
jgi:hypothetical protein